MTAAMAPRHGAVVWSRLGVGAAVGSCAGFLLRDLLPLEAASWWVPAALAGALVWSTRLRSALVVLVLALTTAWAVVGFTPVTALLTPPLIRREPPRSADAVFVLASRLQLDGDPTAIAQARLLHGIELLAQGLAPRLILTDLPGPIPGHEAVARAQLSRLGLSTPEILSVRYVQSTRDEAVRVAALCRLRGWNRVLVVSSPLHSRRACAAVEHEGLEVICSPAVETEYDLATLGRPVERFSAFRRVLYESFAIWVYRSRGWLQTRKTLNAAA